MNRYIKISLWLLLAIYLLTNFTPINYFLKQNYTYTNIDGSFQFSEETGKGFNYESVVRNYAIFLCRHPDKDLGDNRLFRTFTFKPWYIPEWNDMIFHSDRFFLPYKAP